MEPEVASVPAAPTETYASNPFRPLLNVVGKSLVVNGVTALQLGIMGVLVAVAAYLVVLLGGVLIASVSRVGAIIAVPVAIVVLGYFLLAVTAGFIKLCEDGAQDLAGTWKNYFKVGRQYAWKLFGLFILMALGITIGFALLILPGIYLMGRWGLAPFALVQENLGIMAAFKRSRQLSSGHIWEILGSGVAGILLGSNGFLAGLVFPSGMIGRYNQLRDLETGKVSKPKLHWLNWLLVLVFPVLLGGIVALSALSSIHRTQQDKSPTFEQLYQQEQQNSLNQ